MVFRTPAIMKFLYPSLIWEGEKDKIYLTFDDGPVPEVTEFVLDQLDQFEVKATFFCIGDNIKKHPEIFRKVISAGHQVGNHTMHHLKGWDTDDQVYLDDVKLCRDQINEYLPGRKTELFRPPYGRIKRSQIAALPTSYKIIMWTALSQDYRSDLTPEQCLQGTIRAIRPGSVILFHDSLKARKNMEYALPRVIEFAKTKGFTFGLI